MLFDGSTGSDVTDAPRGVRGVQARRRLCETAVVPLDGHLLLAFLGTTLIAMLAPGPDMLFVLGCGMKGGPRAGLLATAGVATSEAIHIALAAAGLAALLAAVPTAFTVVRLVGGAYLVYLGVQVIRRRNDAGGAVPTSSRRISSGRAYVRGFLTNLLNPKMVTFTVAFLPQFVDPRLGHVSLQFALLGAIIIALEFLVDGTVGVLAGRIGAVLRRRRGARRAVDTVTGGVFIGLGVRLAVTR